jgi:predicted metal-binding membrane protein
MRAVAPPAREPGQWISVHWPWLLVGAAWATALAANTGGRTNLLSHHAALERGPVPLPLNLLAFVLAWQLMTVAMMLPSSLPLMNLFRHANWANRGSRLATGGFLAGYLVVWTAFALAALLGDALIHRLVDAWPWLAGRPWLIAGATLIVAGGFQFTPLKERCLAACRSPFAFFVRHYRRGVPGAWELGLRHGRFCLGCCWALMLVMFGLGVGHLVWMAILAGVMLLERTTLRGRHLVPVVGVVLVAWGALVAWHPAWLPAIMAGAGG